MKEKLKSVLLVVGIIVGGFAISGILAALKAEPQRAERTVLAPLVEATQVASESGSLSVVGTGTVRPTREIVLAAEVGGRITSVSPALVSGGAFNRGQVLASVEPADYENALAVAQAEVVQRRFDLLRADEEVAVAKDEWYRSDRWSDASVLPDSTSLGRLAFREPERELARSALRAAEARVRDAQLRLDRTRITAPFSGLVRAKQVDLGQFVAPGQGVASIYSSDEVELVVQMSARQMDLIDPTWQLPQRVGATVTAEIAGRTVEWEGYVHRIEGALDPATRQASVVVRVSNPYGRTGGRPPLLVGTFATVKIQGANLDRFWSVPRASVHQDEAGASSIWLYTEGTLNVAPVEVAQSVEDRIVITSPVLPDSFSLVVSSLSVITDGMTVRTADRP